MIADDRRRMRRWTGLLASALLGLLPAAAPSWAATAEGFYSGKQVKLVVGAVAGGGNDIYARILSRHMPRHIPGKPTVIVVNMPGASSITAANYLQHIAPRDGTEMLEIVQALPMVQAFGQDNINFDLAAFNWIGNMTDSPVVYVAAKAAGVTTIQQAMQRELVYGSTTPASLFAMMPTVMNSLVGTRFKVINGYDSGKAIELAMERGEIGGFGGSTWSSLMVDEPGWIDRHEIEILVQAGVRKAQDLAGVPLLTDLARNDEDRRVLAFYSGVVAYARAFTVGPNVPQDRVAALRRAFDATMADPAFLAEASQIRLDVTPIGGEALQKIITETVHADKTLLARAQAALADGEKK